MLTWRASADKTSYIYCFAFPFHLLQSENTDILLQKTLYIFTVSLGRDTTCENNFWDIFAKIDIGKTFENILDKS